MIMTMFDKAFSIGHKLFDEYHTTVFILTGLGTFFSSLFISILSLIDIYLVIISWLYNKFRVNRSLFSNKYSMEGKTILIIGGITGIGYETSKDLLQRGLIRK